MMSKTSQSIQKHNKKSTTKQDVAGIAYEEFYEAFVKPLKGYKQMILHGVIQEWMWVIANHCVNYKKSLETKDRKNMINDSKKSNDLLKNHIKKYKIIIEDPFIRKIFNVKLAWMNGKIQNDPFKIKTINFYDKVDSVPISKGITKNTLDAIYSDLCKLQEYTRTHKGNLNINNILQDCNFYVIDKEYLELLYFTPKYDYQRLAKDEILSNIHNLKEDFTTSESEHIIQEAQVVLKKIFRRIEYRNLIQYL